MPGLRCVCGKMAKEVDDIDYNGLLFKGWRCKCGQEMVNPRQANLYLKYQKLYKMGKMKAKVRKAGNSFVITIPKILRELLDIKDGKDVDLNLHKKGIVVQV